MARPPRYRAPGAIYHVFTRGVRRMLLFLDDHDRRRFMRLLAITAIKFDLHIRAFCLMGNHVHIYLMTVHPNIHEAMHWLFSTYTNYFNRRHGLTGHVTESRYLSPVVEPGWFEVGLSRYVHLNPVKAGIVESAELYPWSSLSAYTDPERRPRWLRADEVLRNIHGTPAQQIATYLELLGAEMPSDEEAESIYEGTVAIGGEAFLAQHDVDRTSTPKSGCVKPGFEVIDIVDGVAGEFGESPVALILPSRPVREARLAVSLVLDVLGQWSRRELAASLGGVTPRTVRRHIDDAKQLYRGDEVFRARVDTCIALFRANSNGSGPPSPPEGA